MNNTDLVIYNSAFSNKISMTAKQILMVQRSWKLFRNVEPVYIGEVFYNKLFLEVPAVKRLFKQPMTGQYKKLIDMLSVIVGRLDRLEELSDDIRQMAKRHVDYGVKESHYKAVGIALLWTLERGLGNDWNNEVKEAWATCYKLLADTMIEAAGY